MTFDGHALVERGTQPQDAQRIAVAQQLTLALAPDERHIDHDATQGIIHPNQRGAAGIRLGRHAAGEADDVCDRRRSLDFIDGWTIHLTIHSHRAGHGRNEYDVARLQLGVVHGVAAQQQVVKIETPNDGAGALQLDIAQRSKGLQPAGRIERRGDGAETADGIAAGAIRLAHDKHANRTRIAHGDAGTHADQLALHALLDIRGDAHEGLSTDVDRAEFGEADTPVAPDRQTQGAVLAAEQLHNQLVTWPDYVVRRDGDVGDRCKRRGRILEQFVAERLEAA